MVTSFSCLHWVPDQAITIEMLNRVLKPGGKFLFVVNIYKQKHSLHKYIFDYQIASTHHRTLNVQRRHYDQMKQEPAWRDILRPTRYQ